MLSRVRGGSREVGKGHNRKDYIRDEAIDTLEAA